MKRYHRIVVQIVCDCAQFFCNVYVGQLGGIADEGYFKMLCLYCEL